jgi:hypothetical protein
LELVVMAAYYGVSHALDVGHTFRIGEPWLPGSKCDCVLVSLPYPYGPNFQIYRINEESDIQFLWLLPITTPEMKFLAENGEDAIEQLEKRFEECGLQYAKPNRSSVV